MGFFLDSQVNRLLFTGQITLKTVNIQVGIFYIVFIAAWGRGFLNPLYLKLTENRKTRENGAIVLTWTIDFVQVAIRFVNSYFSETLASVIGQEKS